MGHSMGGIVATSLLPSANISTIITMSTPHVLPPARFDSRIESLYRRNQRTLDVDPTPIVSLCGGATDMMIPSESCILPSPRGVFRRTVFTSALEGAWTGVGHREMVWCHQVRWRVARAALEIGVSPSPAGGAAILDKWLRDGHTHPPTISGPKDTGDVLLLADRTAYEFLPVDFRLVLNNPQRSRMYLLPITEQPELSPAAKVTLLVSQGSIPPVSPQNPIPLRVSVFICRSTSQGEAPKCNSLEPSAVRLVPNPPHGRSFPMAGEGSDESEGVVLYEANISITKDGASGQRWVGVQVEDADGRGWVVGGFNQESAVSSDASLLRKDTRMIANYLGNLILVYWQDRFGVA